MEAVIFDVDGVLADTEPLHLEAANAVLAPYGVAISEEENMEFLGMDDPSFWKAMMERYRLQADPRELQARRVEYVLGVIRDREFLPRPGVPQVITGMLMRGLLLAAASSSPRAVTEAVIEVLGLQRSFRAVLTGDDVTRGKPDPEIFFAAARALDVPPGACMVIEDSPAGIQAARRAGMFAVGVRSRWDPDLEGAGAQCILSGLDRFDWTLFEER